MAVSYPTVACMYAAHFGTARAMRDSCMTQARYSREGSDARDRAIRSARDWHRDAMNCLRRMRQWAKEPI
jgi:hypothetical protein